MKSLSLWQNMEDDKEKGGGEGQESHQPTIKHSKRGNFLNTKYSI